MLSSVNWWIAADVSGQPIGPIFRGQAVQEDTMSQKSAINHQSTLSNIPQKSKDLIYTEEVGGGGRGAWIQA
jgi:hypothetical protein